MESVYQTQVEGKIVEEIRPSLLSLGYELVRVRMLRSRHKIVQIMLDRSDDAPLSVDDCEKASRHISPILDALNLINDHYDLEISSAGLERPLTRLKDYQNNVGRLAKITLYRDDAEAVGGKKFTAVILKIEADGVLLQPTNKEHSLHINWANLKEATLAIENLYQKKIKSKRGNHGQF